MTLHVAALSGSRADFGPLQPLIAGLRDDGRFRLSTIMCAVAAGDEAERQRACFADAGLPIDATVTAPAASSAGSDVPSMADQASRALGGVAQALREIGPELVVLLGDRFEILAAAVAAHLERIPIVHLSGGDETLGSLDDAMRHAISRLSALHLPTNEESARRLLGLGIPENRITIVGSTAIDALVAFRPMSRAELADSIGADLTSPVIVVTYHPATQAKEPPAETFRMLITGIRDAAAQATIVVTGSNADEGGVAIDVAAHEIATMDPRLMIAPTLGVERYWSLMHHADAVVGNSSSALIEAPVIGIPVVDVGERQASRLRAASCIHAAAERAAIAAGLAAALTRGRIPEPSPYGDGGSVPRILDLLAGIEDPSALLQPTPLLPVEP